MEIRTSLLRLLSDQSSQDFDENELFAALGFILCDDRKLVEAAIETLDSIQYIRMITSTSSSRRFWVVPGSKGVEYLCLSNSCSCKRFMELMKLSQTRESLLCKHLVAVQLAEKIGMVKEQVFKNWPKLMCRQVS